jgi:hypothetical protein
VRSCVYALLALLLAHSSVNAQAFYCSKPSDPSCISLLGIVKDEFQIQMCRMEIENFRDATKRYIECLDNEQRASIRNVSAVIERFNNCMRTSICY